MRYINSRFCTYDFIKICINLIFRQRIKSCRRFIQKNKWGILVYGSCNSNFLFLSSLSFPVTKIFFENFGDKVLCFLNHTIYHFLIQLSDIIFFALSPYSTFPIASIICFVFHDFNILCERNIQSSNATTETPENAA